MITPSSGSKKFSDLLCLPNKVLTPHGLVSKDFCNLASACLFSFMPPPSPPGLTYRHSVVPRVCPGPPPPPLRGLPALDIGISLIVLIILCLSSNVSSRLSSRERDGGFFQQSPELDEGSINTGISLGKQEPHGYTESPSLPFRTA